MITLIVLNMALAIGTLIFGIHRWVKVVVVLAPLALAFAFSSELWAQQYIERTGCTGNALKGLTCPHWSLTTKIAVAHQLSTLVISLVLLFALPVITFFSLLLSLFARSRSQD